MRLYLISFLLVVAVATSWHSPVSAQITFDGCSDIRGVPVASIMDYYINDVAIASLAPSGSPIIRYNPRVLLSLHPQTRLWIYAHECGHHALGHNFGTTHPLATEQAADCFATRELISRGILSLADLEIVQGDIAKAGPGDWTHLPGPIRAFNLNACLGATTKSLSFASNIDLVMTGLHEKGSGLRGSLKKTKGNSRYYEGLVDLHKPSLGECKFVAYGSKYLTSYSYSCYWSNKSIEPMQQIYGIISDALDQKCTVSHSRDIKGSKLNGTCDSDIKVEGEFGKVTGDDYYIHLDFEYEIDTKSK